MSKGQNNQKDNKVLHIAFVMWCYFKIILHRKRRLLKLIQERMVKEYLLWTIRCSRNANAVAYRDELLNFYKYLHAKDNPPENCADTNTVDDYLGINAAQRLCM
jgi:hypothetical protein